MNVKIEEGGGGRTVRVGRGHVSPMTGKRLTGGEPSISQTEEVDGFNLDRKFGLWPMGKGVSIDTPKTDPPR